MYNGEKINKLLAERKIKKTRLIEYLGTSNSGMRSIILGNPTVNNIEKVADFFHVSTDFFFDRNIEVAKMETEALFVEDDQSLLQRTDQLSDLRMKEREFYFKSLLEEKERIIIEKERTIQILLKQR